MTLHDQQPITLSRRETQVAHAISQGCQRAEIAAKLQLSEETVKSHLDSLRRKLGARDAGHAVSLMWELGLLNTRIIERVREAWADARVPV